MMLIPPIARVHCRTIVRGKALGRQEFSPKLSRCDGSRDQPKISRASAEEPPMVLL
jgi:hypothetical protein